MEPSVTCRFLTQKVKNADTFPCQDVIMIERRSSVWHITKGRAYIWVLWTELPSRVASQDYCFFVSSCWRYDIDLLFALVVVCEGNRVVTSATLSTLPTMHKCDVSSWLTWIKCCVNGHSSDIILMLEPISKVCFAVMDASFLCSWSGVHDYINQRKWHAHSRPV